MACALKPSDLQPLRNISLLRKLVLGTSTDRADSNELNQDCFDEVWEVKTLTRLTISTRMY